MKKRQYLLLLGVMLSLNLIQAQWKIDKCPTRNNLFSISLPDPNSGWIVGEKGIILQKSEGFWKQEQSPTNENLYSVHMINGGDGWAVGASGTIIHFDGKQWKTCASPTKEDLHSVKFRGSEYGIAVGKSGTLLIFRNGIWEKEESDIRGDLFTTCFDNNHFWIAGGLECNNVPIMRFLEEDKKTKFNSFDSFSYINSIAFADSSVGWAVGSPSTLLHFNGQTWEKPLINYKFPSLKSVDFSNRNNGICVGYSGTIMTYSNDTWKLEDFKVEYDLNCAVISGNYYYVIGDHGTIIFSQIETGNNRESLTDSNLSNPDMFPNPCNDFLNIVVPNENNYRTISVSIIDIKGQILNRQYFKPAEEGVITLNTSDLKGGQYLIKVTNGYKTYIGNIIVRH